MSKRDVFKVLSSMLIVTSAFTAGGICRADIETDLQRAKEFLAAGKYESAIQACAGLSSAEPYFQAQVNLCLGECYKGQRKHKESIDALKAGIELATPGADANDSAWDLLRRLKFNLVEDYRLASDYGSAIDLYQKLIVDYPGEAGYSKYWLGRSYMMKGDYNSATATADQLASEHPDVLDRHVLVWECLCVQSKVAEALAYLDRLQEECPDLGVHAPLWKGEALLMYARDYEQTANVVNGILSEYPDDPLAKIVGGHLLAVCLRHADRVDDAVAAVKSAVPENAGPEQIAESLEHVVNIYLEAKRYGDAINVCRQLSDSEGLSYQTKARAAFNMANCYQGMGDNSAAESAMRGVVDNYPESDVAKVAGVMLESWSVAN